MFWSQEDNKLKDILNTQPKQHQTILNSQLSKRRLKKSTFYLSFVGKMFVFLSQNHFLSISF